MFCLVFISFVTPNRNFVICDLFCIVELKEFFLVYYFLCCVEENSLTDVCREYFFIPLNFSCFNK